MSQQELLIRVVETFDRLGLPYLVTGSVASSFHGEPRATHDADVVVALTEEAIPPLKRSLSEPTFYFEPRAAHDAIVSRGMFNILSVETGDKVDCWMLTDSEFDRSRLERRRSERLFGRLISIQSAEDTIISKLLWAKESGGSEKQLSDVRAIIRLRSGEFDEAYIERWIGSLGLDDLWRRCVCD